MEKGLEGGQELVRRTGVLFRPAASSGLHLAATIVFSMARTSNPDLTEKKEYIER